MPSRPEYRVEFAPEVIEHVDSIDRKYHGLIRAAIQERLKFDPGVVTRNRKPLEQPAPFEATWELRFGPDNCFRVFYEVDESDLTVWILAIGLREGNRLVVGREEFEP